MQPKANKRSVRFLVVFAGAILLLVLFGGSATERNGNTTLAATAASVVVPMRVLPIGVPVRLTIPKIKVDAELESVSLMPDGTMDVPKEQSNAAWFNLGIRPGENGSAVIAGHYGWKGGRPSVFDSVHALSIGDELSVEDENGNTISFVVREIKEYDPKADASAVFNSYDGKSHLNLITCEGMWDAVSKSYSKRLVVFADKVLTE